jgi:hypothetical protein
MPLGPFTVAAVYAAGGPLILEKCGAIWLFRS